MEKYILPDSSSTPIWGYFSSEISAKASKSINIVLNRWNGELFGREYIDSLRFLLFLFRKWLLRSPYIDSHLLTEEVLRILERIDHINPPLKPILLASNDSIFDKKLIVNANHEYPCPEILDILSRYGISISFFVSYVKRDMQIFFLQSFKILSESEVLTKQDFEDMIRWTEFIQKNFKF
jgi:hypothetical protein